MKVFIKREKGWLGSFLAIVVITALILFNQHNNALKFTFTIHNNDMIIQLSQPNIRVRSIDFTDPVTNASVFTQDVYQHTAQVIIKDYNKMGLIAGKAYYFVMFLEDSREPSKRIETVDFCMKGDKIIQMDDTTDLKGFEKSYQTL